MRQSIVGWSVLAAAVCACGSSPAPLKQQDSGDDSGAGVSSGSGSGNNGTFGGGDGGSALTVDIEGSDGTVLNTLSMMCTGDCIDVQAVAQGGNPPVTYKWGDGSTGASRHLCPTSSTSYSVTATDTAVTSGELSRGSETASATLAVSCADGGRSEVDAGSLCISNPTFNGTVFTDIDAPPWVDCGVPASIINNSFSPTTTMHYPDAPAPLAPNSTYLLIGAQADPFVAGNANGAVAEPLCAPMQAGTTYSVKIDLADVPSSPASASLLLIGSTSSCGSGEVLWSSPTPSSSWHTYCATFTPSHDTPYLELAAVPEADGAPMGILLVSNMQPVPSCE